MGAGFDETAGWQFTTSGPITVTSLGIWDPTNATNGSGTLTGLADSHQVGIFDTTAAHSLLASETISGTLGSIQGTSGFRFLDLVTPLPLLAGTYHIGATYSAGDADNNVFGATATTASGVTYGGAQVFFGSGLNDPNHPATPFNAAFFGPDFQFTTSAATVPEPASTTLMGLGGLGAFLTARRRKRKVAVTLRVTSPAGRTTE